MTEYEGPACVSALVRGAARLETERGRFDVEPGKHLLLFADRRYRLRLVTRGPALAIVVAFRAGWLCGDERDPLADTPAERAPAVDASVEVLEATPRRDQQVSQMLGSLHVAVRRGVRDEAWLDGCVSALAERIRRALEEVRRAVERAPAVRSSTRLELARRAYLAREFIEGHLDQPLKLDGLAREARLSAFHFHRVYRAVFGETPRAYALRRRLERGRELLARARGPVGVVAQEVGFPDGSSFATAYRRQFGETPSETLGHVRGRRGGHD